MYVFGIAIVFGLGVMCVARWVERPVRQLQEGLRELVPLALYPVAEVALGISLAWAVHFNLWALWGVAMRGRLGRCHLDRCRARRYRPFLYRGLSDVLRLGRKLHDEAETTERPKLERVA